MRKICGITILLLLINAYYSFSIAAITCPSMPMSITEISRDVKTDINASVASLGKVKAGDVATKIEVTAKNLFSKYPNVDKLLTLQTMAATYCTMLRDTTALNDKEKLDRWERFQEKVLNLQSNPPKKRTPEKPKVKNRSHRVTNNSELTLGGRVVNDSFVYELNSCKRYDNTVACDMSIEQFGFEDRTVWVSSDDGEVSERNLTDTYTYLLDNKGVKHTWPELRPTSPGSSVFEGPTLDCKFTKDTKIVFFSLGFKGVDKSATYIKKLNLEVEHHTAIETVPSTVSFEDILIR